MSDKIPKPILAVREKLAKLGLPITAENMQLHISSGDINKAAGALRTALKNTNPDNAGSYKTLDRAEQRHWPATFAIDANASRCLASESTSRATKHEQRTRVCWLSKAQLASDAVLASAEDAELFAQGAAPEDRRPSKFKALAEKGREEFRIELDDEQFAKVFKEETKVDAKSEMKADDYEKIKEAMHEETSPPEPKRQRKDVKKELKALEDMSPEERVIHEAQQSRRKEVDAFRAAQAQGKRSGDKARKTVEDAQKDAAKLVEKGMPKELQQFYMDAFIPLMTQTQELLQLYADNAKTNLLTESEANVKEMRENVERATNQLDADFKAVNDEKIKSLKTLMK